MLLTQKSAVAEFFNEICHDRTFGNDVQYE
jgi:hypothetical protein